jgi:hypothetical protein
MQPNKFTHFHSQKTKSRRHTQEDKWEKNYVPLIVDNDMLKNSSFHIPSHYSVPDRWFRQ